MPAPLDLDQIRTFVAIANSGSFTKAADEVHRTQSAVSMQMRRLEERIGLPLFEKDGRANRLTENGQKLLVHARRLLQVNHETLAAFDSTQLHGELRIGVPDDYADRFLPEIMARFSRSHPLVELSVICEPTANLEELIRRGSLDIAIITHYDETRRAEIVRREALLWVTSANHATHEQTPLPLALGRPTCVWRRAAIESLEEQNRDYRILFTSWSATVVAAAVLSGLAISVLPECALRPGMKVLGENEGFVPLEPCAIGVIRGTHRNPATVEAMAMHIRESLDNLAAALPMPDPAQNRYTGTHW